MYYMACYLLEINGELEHKRIFWELSADGEFIHLHTNYGPDVKSPWQTRDNGRANYISST